MKGRKIKIEIKDSKREILEPDSSLESAQVKSIAHDADGKALLTAQKIRQTAENKVATGISKVLALAKSKATKNNIPADFQGIKTVVLSKQEIIDAGVDEKFPFLQNQKNGITVHIFAKDAIQFPPIGYILDQKMSSLLSVFKMMIQGKENKYFKYSYKIDIKDIFNKQMTDKIKAICDTFENEIVTLTKNMPLNQWNNLVTSSIQSAIAKVLHVLYETYCKLEIFSNKLNFEEFAKMIIKESSHHRSNDNHTLTYSEGTGIFSFDEVVSPVTAHDRTIGKDIANLSMVYEGRIKEDDEATISSSTFKHASPVAIDDVKTWYVSDMGESDAKLLADTEKNIKQIATAMAQFQVHGGADKSQPVQVDWTYQLLTSNAGDRQEQARTYGYIVKAKNALNGKTFSAEKGNFSANQDLKVQLNMHVMNAGINIIGGLELGHKSTTQRQENRLAFLHLSKALASHLDIVSAVNAKKPCNPSDTTNLEGFIKSLIDTYKNGLIPSTLAEELNKIDAEYSNKVQTLNQQMNDKIKSEAEKIRAPLVIKTQEYRESFERYKKLNDSIDTIKSDEPLISIMQFINKEAQDKIDLLTKKIEKQYNAKIQAARSDRAAKILTKHEIIENEMKARWQKSGFEEVQNAMKIMKQSLDQALKLDPQVLTSITALIYKTYIDDLYYSGEYRKPEKAVLFNTYVAAYQRLTGLSGSIGCKSANDRTYVLRLFLAAVEGRDHQAKPLPAAYHQDPQALQQLLAQDVSQRVMSNTAIYSCINDTGGGTPKVHDGFSGFPFLKPVKGINLLDKFGKFAAEKLKKMISKFNSLIKQSSTLFSQSKPKKKNVKQNPAHRMYPTDS